MRGTLSDLRREGAARERALAFVGPPRPKAKGTHDADGLLLTFTGRHCKDCAVELTNRNRLGRQLLCRPCYRTRDRARVRRRGVRRPRDRDAELRALLRKAIPPPVQVIEPHRQIGMQRGKDAELRFLLLRALPAPLQGLAGLPLDDPGEDLLPHHFTTKAEFLATADTYKVR